MSGDFFKSQFHDIKCPVCTTNAPYFARREWGERDGKYIYGSRFVCRLCHHSWTDVVVGAGYISSYVAVMTVTREELERAERHMPPLVDYIMDQIVRRVRG